MEVHTPKNALSLNNELIELRKRVKELDKENRRLKEENEFLEAARRIRKGKDGAALIIGAIPTNLKLLPCDRKTLCLQFF